MNGEIKAQRGRTLSGATEQPGQAVHGQDQSCFAAFLVLSVHWSSVCMWAHMCRSGVFVAALEKVEARAHNCHVVWGYCSPFLSGLRCLGSGPAPERPVYSKHDESGLTSSRTWASSFTSLGLTFLTVKQIEHWRHIALLRDL